MAAGAIDAPGRVRDGLQSRPSDFAIAVLAGSIGSRLDSLERRFYLLEELLFVLSEDELLVESFDILIAGVHPRSAMPTCRHDIFAERFLGGSDVANKSFAEGQQPGLLLALVVEFHLRLLGLADAS